MATDDKPRKGPRGFAKNFALIAMTVLCIKVAAPVLSTNTAQVTLVDAQNIPATCSSGLTGGTRSGVPDDTFVAYCGVVYTSLGLFKLVESGSLNPLAMRREDMVAAMKPSCRYRIWFNGRGPMPSPEVRSTNRVSKTIFRMTPLDGCATSPPSP